MYSKKEKKKKKKCKVCCKSGYIYIYIYCCISEQECSKSDPQLTLNWNHIFIRLTKKIDLIPHN